MRADGSLATGARDALTPLGTEPCPLPDYTPKLLSHLQEPSVSAKTAPTLPHVSELVRKGRQSNEPELETRSSNGRRGIGPRAGASSGFVPVR